MDRVAELFFKYEAKVALYRKKGTVFQDHFNDLMTAVHGSRFIRVRPAGTVGDESGAIRAVINVTGPASRWSADRQEEFRPAILRQAELLGRLFGSPQHSHAPTDEEAMLM